MKPQEARAQRRAQDQSRAARGKQLEDYLQSGESTATVIPHLIPSEEDLQAATGEVRARARRAERTDRNKRGKALDDLYDAFRRLVYVERVCEMDRLERAALTPAQLVPLSRVTPAEVQARVALWRDASNVMIP